MKTSNFGFDFVEGMCIPSRSRYAGDKLTGVEVGVSVEDSEPILYVTDFDPGRTGYTAEEWYGLVQSIYAWPAGQEDGERPDPQALLDVLESEEFQQEVEAAVSDELVCGLDYSSGNVFCGWAEEHPHLDRARAMLEAVPARQWAVWDVEDWLEAEDAQSLGISATSSDEELERIAEEIYNEALEEGVVVENIFEYLETLRKEKEVDGEVVS